MAVKVRHALLGIDIHKELVVSGLTKYFGLQDEFGSICLHPYMELIAKIWKLLKIFNSLLILCAG